VRLSASAALAVSFATCLVPSVAHAADPDRVEWSDDWHRVRLVEALDPIALGIGSLLINGEWKPPTHPTVKGGILFDNWVRKELVGHNESLQAVSAKVTDNFMLGTMAAPFLIDVYLVTLGVHENADVAAQEAVIDAQSLALTGIISLTAEHAVGRSRPYVADCRSDGTVRSASGEILLNHCSGPADYQSFFSGHSGITATMAGLTCIHHQHLPLYGGGFADLAPCLVMIGISVTTGFGRLVADKHWATDVLTGWSIGTVSGYFLPAFLHYGFGSGRPIGELNVAGLTLTPMPQVYRSGAGLGVVASF
jgi:membrane-associated phospholipid phosphatase